MSRCVCVSYARPCVCTPGLDVGVCVCACVCDLKECAAGRYGINMCVRRVAGDVWVDTRGEGCMHSGAAAFTRQRQKEPIEDWLYFQFKASG